MMNAQEQRFRQFNQSHGELKGVESTFGEDQVEDLDEDQVEDLEQVTGNIPSIIAPEEPFDPDPVPEVDPAPPQPEIPTQPAHPNIPPHPNTPVDSTSPTELPPHIAPPLA